MKECGDKLCRRLGKRLRASAFPVNNRRVDKLGPYCRECSVRRVHEYRARKKITRLAQKEARLRLQVELPRKPNITATERVKQAIERGATTIELIKQETKFNYDLLGDLLVEMVWESKTVKIERRPEGKREFHIAA